ncbi:MAG: hypothetical protein LC781_03495, partial [Actinobacteria bacterium]|nr:hypothetical protein [Actinomycetota bacterium]
KRDGYLDLAAEGFMSRDELGVKLADVDKQKTEYQRELDAVLNRRQRLDELSELIVILGDDQVWLPWLERAEDDPDGYKKPLQKLKLRVIVYADWLELTGDFGDMVRNSNGKRREPEDDEETLIQLVRPLHGVL